MSRILKSVESRVARTIKEFGLVASNDRILCAASGGKDSTVVLHIMNKLYKRVEAITIDASIGDYTRNNLKNIQRFCSENRIKLHVVSFRTEFGHSLCYLRSILKSKGLNLNSCAICGVLKRYLLNKKAREWKKTLLVTGHNMDDEAQSILMNLLRCNLELLARLGPKSGVRCEKKFVQRIKPLYKVPERDIEEYSRQMRFPVLYGKCPCAVDSYRNKVRQLLNRYEARHPGTKQAILENFLRLKPRLRQEFAGQKGFGYCTSCGEPAKNSLCRACALIHLGNLKIQHSLHKPHDS